MKTLYTIFGDMFNVHIMFEGVFTVFMKTYFYNVSSTFTHFLRRVFQDMAFLQKFEAIFIQN